MKWREWKAAVRRRYLTRQPPLVFRAAINAALEFALCFTSTGEIVFMLFMLFVMTRSGGRVFLSSGHMPQSFADEGGGWRDCDILGTACMVRQLRQSSYVIFSILIIAQVTSQ